MTDKHRANYFFCFMTSIFLVLVGHFFILQRTQLANKQTYLSVGGDAEKYVQMAEGKWKEVAAPFRFRVLVPWLSSLMPFNALDSLRIWTYIGLFGFYFFVMLISLRLQISTGIAIVGIITAYISTWQFYQYHNPFLVDGIGLLALVLLIYAFMTERFWLFLGIAILGILARETVIFLIPLWFIKDVRKAIILLFISTIVLLIPRIVLKQTTDTITLSSAFMMIGLPRLKAPFETLKQIALSWGSLWIILVVGLVTLNRAYRIHFIFATMLLFCGSMATTLIAYDTGRMFFILSPMIAIVATQFYSEISKANYFSQHQVKILATVWIVLLIIKFHITLPNIVFSKESWIFAQQKYRGIFGAIEISFVGIVAVWFLLRFYRTVKKEKEKQFFTQTSS